MVYDLIEKSDESYTVNVDSSDIYGFRKSFSKNTFSLMPVTEFSLGYQSETEDKFSHPENIEFIKTKFFVFQLLIPSK